MPRRYIYVCGGWRGGWVGGVYNYIGLDALLPEGKGSGSKRLVCRKKVKWGNKIENEKKRTKNDKMIKNRAHVGVLGQGHKIER